MSSNIKIPKSVHERARDYNAKLRSIKKLTGTDFDSEDCFVLSSRTVYLDTDAPYELHNASGFEEFDVPDFVSVINLMDCDISTIPLKAIRLSDSVKHICSFSFKDSLLENVVFNTAIGHIGKSAFERCKLKGALSLPSKVRLIEGYNFRNTPIATVDWVSELHETIVPEYAFAGCDKLERVSIESKGVLKLYCNAFSGCLSVKKIVLKAKEIYIGDAVFSNNMNLQEVDIDAKQLYFKSNVFRNDNKLSKMSLPNKDTIYYTKDSFEGCNFNI